jgi:glycerate 2-kinase
VHKNFGLNRKDKILMTMRRDARYIMATALKAVQPDAAVAKALQGKSFGEGRIVLLAIGKASWQMASTATKILAGKIDRGLVITKYGYSKGNLPNLEICEAGHPVPDANSFAATEKAMQLVQGLTEQDTVVMLISGGGSSLFEKPLLPIAEIQTITEELLARGANIVEINTIRKRFSAVKGGKFALLCAPAHIYAIILSDVIGDHLDVIASGPVTADTSTVQEAMLIAAKYNLTLSPAAVNLLHQETPKIVGNVETIITGSVKKLCAAGAKACAERGYEVIVLTTELECEAADAGRILGAVAAHYGPKHRKLAFLAGGETVVKVTGNGKGGRNQEIALAAAQVLAGLTNAAAFSFSSDGSDGPTDAAGGFVDGNTKEILAEKGISIAEVLKNNDSYHALEACGGLLKTGPTGTNVNDLSIVLINA